MTISKKSIYITLIHKFFVSVMFLLLLSGGYGLKAQNNTNGTNVNVERPNVNVNRRDNANVNTNVNTNANTNTGQNGNVGNTNTYSEQKAEERKNTLANSPWFFAVISLMFGTILIPFVFVIVRAIRLSSSTYRSPLGLPEGSFRAMLAYTLVAFLGFYLLAGILSLTDFKPPEFLLGIVATVIGFYFGSRSGEDRPSGPKPSGIVQGNVTDKNGSPAGGANVVLSPADGKKIVQKTDATGRYKFENVLTGEYEIQASQTGQMPSDPAKVTVTAGIAQNVNLTLK